MKTALTLRENNHTSHFIKFKIAALVIVTLLAFSSKGSCADSTHLIKSKNAFYVAVAGQGNNRSINFERVFRQGHAFNYSYSAGFSTSGKNVSIPFSLNAITTGKQHHLDISLGLIPYLQHHTYAKKKADTDKQLYIKPAIGYRYQKTTSGLFFKATIGPQLLIDPPAYNVLAASVTLVKPSAQVALGISF